MPRLSINAAETHPTTVRHYRPPDPEWADAALLERVRQELVAENARNNLWWNPNWKEDDPKQPGRWAFMQWLERTHCWGVVFYFEGPAGEFRPIDPSSVGVLMHRVRACREDAVSLMKRIDAARRERNERRLAELTELRDEITDRGIKLIKGAYRQELIPKLVHELEVERMMREADIRQKHAEEDAALARDVINREMFAA